MGPTYQAVEDELDEYESQQWSPRAKRWAVAVAVFAGCAVTYFFCFVLPNMFIPEAVPLHEIVKVKQLGVDLRPVAPEKAAIWFDKAETTQRVEEDVETEGTLRLIKPGDKPVDDSHLKNRLILIGDIHGQQKELHKLLRKINFSKLTDLLLVLGDFIAKGFNSLEVVDDLIELGAQCILGNHEVYVLQYYTQFHRLPAPDLGPDSDRDQLFLADGFNVDPEFLLAKKLQPRHVQYINSCPVIMELGPVPLHKPARTDSSRKLAHGLAVHAGLRWGVEPADQNPWDCLEMRSYLGPHYNETTDDPADHKAKSWSKVWNQKHKAGEVDDDYVVYYGHDAHRGLALKKWAKGLDSGCFRGDQLLAMVIWREKTAKGVVHREKVVQVDC